MLTLHRASESTELVQNWYTFETGYVRVQVSGFRLITGCKIKLRVPEIDFGHSAVSQSMYVAWPDFRVKQMYLKPLYTSFPKALKGYTRMSELYIGELCFHRS